MDPAWTSSPRQGTWPAVRKATIDYNAAAYPGDVLRFHQTLTHHGRTSFTIRQTARRVRDDALIATAELVFVCINGEGKPVPVPAEFGEFMNARPAPPGSARRVTVNGVNLAVDVRGEGSAVLFIHGYPLDRTIWEPQLAALNGWRRIAPDLRGMGLSDAPDLGYSMATMQPILRRCSTRWPSIGRSLRPLHGRLRSVRVCAAVAGTRSAGLVLIDTRAEADTAEGGRLRDAAAALARDGGAEAVTESLLPRVLGRSTRTGASITAERVRGIMSSTPVSGLVGALAAMRDRPDSSPLLPDLAGLPTLVMVGEEDELTPPAPRVPWPTGFPDARLIIIPGSGHLPPVERPVETTRALVEFLRALR